MSATTHVNLHLPAEADTFPSYWTWHRLEEISTGVFDCHHSTPKLTLEGPYVVRSQDILNGVLDMSNIGQVSEDTYLERISRAEPRHGDILYSREGTYFGIAAEVPPNTRLCLGQRMVLIRPDSQKLSSRFLRYWLNSAIMSRHLHGFRDGSVAERLNMSTIRALPIPLPPLAEQREIARILGALDDKIDLNRRMNATLEATARALFQSWFVDFDPVHAKAEGRQPEGMDAETAALFPDSFEESPLGMIPSGWGVGTFGDVAEFNTWTLSKRDDLDLIEYVEISEVHRGEIGEVKSYFRGEEPSRARRRLRHGDTVISTVRPDRGSYFLCLNPSPNLIASTGFAVFSPLTTTWSFLHCALTRPEIFERLGALADGAAYPAVAPEIIAGLQLVLPPDELMIQFHTLCENIYEMATENRRSSRTLAETRDVLLPKLISGEVRV